MTQNATHFKKEEGGGKGRLKIQKLQVVSAIQSHKILADQYCEMERQECRSANRRKTQLQILEQGGTFL